VSAQMLLHSVKGIRPSKRHG